MFQINLYPRKLHDSLQRSKEEYPKYLVNIVKHFNLNLPFPGYVTKKLSSEKKKKKIFKNSETLAIWNYLNKKDM